MSRIDPVAIVARIQHQVWPVYEAAEEWQERYEHACDARCAAIKEIPDLTADAAALAAELASARESERRANNLYAAARSELRAARRVVEDARGGPGGALLAESLAAYDRAVVP